MEAIVTAAVIVAAFCLVGYMLARNAIQAAPLPEPDPLKELEEANRAEHEAWNAAFFEATGKRIASDQISIQSPQEASLELDMLQRQIERNAGLQNIAIGVSQWSLLGSGLSNGYNALRAQQARALAQQQALTQGPGALNSPSIPGQAHFGNPCALCHGHHPTGFCPIKALLNP